jgi:hypothetical protein
LTKRSAIEPNRAVALQHQRMPRRLSVSMLLALCTGAALAQGNALLDAPTCRRAMDRLQARESALAEDRGNAALRASLATARRAAAVACLGGPDTPASAPPRAAQPAAASGTSTPRAVPVTPPATTPQPTVRVPAQAPPATLTACDAGGCWTSDGTRLQRVGPGALLGPRGLCTTNGNFVQCPP